MKIIILIDNFGPGGLQKSGFFLANSFAEDGNEVIVCALQDKSLAWELNSNVELKTLHSQFDGNKFAKLIQLYKAVKEFKKILNHERPNTVIVLGDLMLLVARLSLPKNIVLIGSERNAPDRYTKAWKFIIGYLYEKCDFVVFQTDIARHAFNDKILEHSCVIPNPYIPVGKKKLMHQNEAEYVSTAAARFEFKKGIDVLIKAFASISTSFPDLQLVIIGEGSLRNSYEALIDELGIKSKVIFPGLVNNVSEKLLDTKIFVLPSRYEGIPNVMMEIMGVGVPVIASDCPSGGPRLLSNDGKVSILFKNDDVSDLAEKLEMLLNDEAARHRLGSEGQKYVQTEFSKEKIYTRWRDVITDLVSRNNNAKF